MELKFEQIISKNYPTRVVFESEESYSGKYWVSDFRDEKKLFYRVYNNVMLCSVLYLSGGGGGINPLGSSTPGFYSSPLIQSKI